MLLGLSQQPEGTMNPKNSYVHKKIYLLYIYIIIDYILYIDLDACARANIFSKIFKKITKQGAFSNEIPNFS